MPLKLLVSKPDEPASKPDAFVFQQERISIGRDSANDLPLDDFKRVVSKHHAEVVADGANIHLTDLGSKNFTYLNKERLQAGRPYPVKPGDTIRIGDFEIVVEVLEDVFAPPRKAESYEDRTVFDASFVNPFEDGAKLLAVALRSLSKQYDGEPASRRDDALLDALRAAMEGDVTHAAYQQVAHLLAPEKASKPTPKPTPEHPPTVTKSPPPVVSMPAVGGNRLHTLVDTILRSMARLIRVPWQFRHEFIGQTIMQSEETMFLYSGDAETLKRALLDPNLSDEEAGHRLHLLEEAVQEVEMHQVAMLDGYKAGVRDGAMRLIDQLNPDALEQEAAKESVLYRLLPPLAKAEALKRLRGQLLEMRSEDWAAAERRAYRPAYIKAYLALMTAARRQDSQAGGF